MEIESAGRHNPAHCSNELPNRDTEAERYQLSCQLADGDAGIVYKAWDARLHKFVALKVLQIDRLQCSQLLCDEVAIAQRLTHPGIVRTHDLVVLHGQPAISMEYVDGPSLSELLHLEGPLSAHNTTRLAEQLFQALDYAHQAGIIHRDLKPANILLDNGKARIADFGLATTVSHTGATSPGTPAYMSPEQRGERPAVDCRTDIYAVGVILFEACVGRRPSEEERRAGQLLRKTLKGISSATLRHVIGRCLAYDREDRFPDAMTALRRLQNERGHLTRILSIQSRASRLRLVIALLVGTLAAWSMFHIGLQGANHAPRVVGLFPIKSDIENREDADLLYEFLAQTMSPGSEARVWKQPAGHCTTLPKEALSQIDVQVMVALARTAEGWSSTITLRFRSDRGRSQVLSVRATSMAELQSRTWSAINEHLAPLVVTSPLTFRMPNLAAADYDRFKQANHTIQWNPRADNEMLRHSIRQLGSISKANPRCSRCLIRRAQGEYILSARTSDAALRDEARSDTRAALKEDSSLGTVLEAVKLEAQYNNRDEAMATLQRPLFTHVRKSLEFKAVLGNILFQDSVFPDAISSLSEVVMDNPWDISNVNLLGMAQLALAHYDQAVVTFSNILKIDNDNVPALNNLAVSYMYGNQFEKAVTPLERVVSIKPTAEAYDNLGMTILYLGKGRVALPFFEKAAKLEPLQEKYAGDIAHAYRWLGMQPEAAQQYKAAVALAKLNVTTYPNSVNLSDLGLYYAALGNREAFSLQFERARALDQHNLDIDYKEAIGFALLADDDRARKNLDRLSRLGYSMGLVQGDPEIARLHWSPPSLQSR
jgi:tetratricopeptide (TPR) repeat protein/predicted Ser/Thr protein kinase